MITTKTLRTLTVVWVLFLATPFQTAGQAAGAEAQPAPTADRLESLLADIEDDDRRAELVATIKTLIAVGRDGDAEAARDDGVIAGLARRLRASSRDLVRSAEALGDLPVLWTWLRGQATTEKARRFWLDLVLTLALAVAAGLVAERLVSFLLRRPRGALEGRAADSVVVRLTFVLLGAILEAAPIAAFAAAAYAVLPLVRPAGEISVVVLTVIYTYALARLLLVAARMVLVSAAPSMRVLPIDAETAHYLFIWTRRFVVIAAAGYCLAEAARHLGLPAGGHAGLQRLIGLVVGAMAVVFILQNRAGVASWLRGDGAAGGIFGLTGLRQRFADIWHVLAVIYIVGAFAVWALDIEGGFEYLARATAASVIIVIVARLVAAGLGRAVDKGFAIGPDVRARFPTLEQRANRYVPVVHGVVRAVVTVVAVFVLLQAWGIDAVAWLETDFGRRVIQGALSIATVVVVALVVWEAASAGIERYMADTDADGNRVERSARIRTLLPLLRNVIFVVLAAMVILIVLSELGVNIAPLLAGAGVFGLAVGFGAQTLVKDIITGLFILIEDTIAVGDYIDVAGHSGTVEGMSLRTLRLRDPAGSVHTVPFSDVGTVLNYTKDFSYAVLDIGIGYSEDVDEVMAVIDELGDAMMEDADLAADILEPLEVQGVNALDDSAVVIRARIKTRPGAQWGMRRAFNRLMKRRFDELGIEIPFPHTTVYFGEGKDGTAPPARIARVAVDSPAPGGADAPTVPPPRQAKPRRRERARGNSDDATDPGE